MGSFSYKNNPVTERSVMTIPLHHIEVERLLALAEAEKNRREELMPDEDSAIKMLFDAYTRLKDFGWRSIIYCPKDGTVFKAIEAGSTGKHDCTYEGEWPNGSWWILADGDAYPSYPTMFKAREET